MRSSSAPKVVAILVVSLTFVSASPAVLAQDEERGRTGTIRKAPPSRPTPTATGPRAPRNTTKVGASKTVVKTVTRGAVAVAAESNATVYLEPLGGGEALEGTVPPGEKNFIFNSLRPGKYRVLAELSGHSPDEKEVTVEPNKFKSVTMNLIQITYNIALSTNAPSGRVMYSGGDGVILTQEIKNSSTVLPNLRPGTYSLELWPSDPAYVPLRTTITVPVEGNRRSFELVRKLTERSFIGSSATAWNLPGGWHMGSAKLVASGQGVALPRDDYFHNYKDFTLMADVKMVNGVAVAFALRAKDAKNYYLIQLTGANAPEPYKFRGFIVRNGTPQPFGNELPIMQFAETINPNRFFRIQITMKGRNIVVKAEDPEDGKLKHVGILSDSDETYNTGAVGVAVSGNERNEIASFTVSPGS